MITREDIIEQSITRFVRETLTSEGYMDGGAVEIIESFPYEFNDVLDKTLVAIGFNFDDQGTQAELGSDLKRRVYTSQFFVIAPTMTWGRNVASAIKFAFDAEPNLPLYDLSAPDQPVFDSIFVIGVSAERQVIPQPEPWQEFVWTVHLHTEDYYAAALA